MGDDPYTDRVPPGPNNYKKLELKFHTIYRSVAKSVTFSILTSGVFEA